MTLPLVRRVVTGLDGAGRSGVVIDGPVRAFEGGGYVWRTAAIPADNSGREDAAPGAFSYDLFHGGGSNFFVIDLAPGERSSTHATDTIDYVVMMAGEVTLELETGEVRLSAGDLVTDRGVIHAWRNDGAEPARYAVVTLPAHPVGAGRTV
ncbi:cupin domain-containing protein [Novosphingobium sp.]|uniref:cupin domain-containing protein n=1 Tax=Novosphingobium sp. TaxID=1874826 RepID=UPI00286D9E61|nr:cupin domain-containing protein [Novosphingobium sp.]